MKIMTYGLLTASIALFSGLVWAQNEIFSETGEFAAVIDTQANRHIIPVESGTTIEVILISDDVDTTLTATLPDGQIITNDDYDDLNAGFIRIIQTSGDLEVVASPLSAGETGSYRVVARTLPPAQMLQLGETVEGRLSTQQQGTPGARFQFAGQAGQRVAIDLKSYDFDTVLTLQTTDGTELADDDGGEHGTNSRLLYNFEQDETVSLAASGLSSDATGAFSISVMALANELMASFEGELALDDTRGYDGMLYDRHVFDAEAGQAIVIELKSDDFDTVLHLSNPDGSNLARQDDSQDGTNSTISVTIPETGEYLLFVTSFGNETGHYRISIYR